MDSRILDLVPVTCPFCSMPTVVRESFTGLSCSDPRCPSKVAERLTSMLDTLGVEGIGYANALSITENFNVRSPLELLQLPLITPAPSLYPSCPESLSVSVHHDLSRALTRSFSLPEFVSLAFIPGVQAATSLGVFGSYTSLEEAYADIHSGGIPFIAQKLNISSGATSLKATSTYEALIEFEDDLITASHYPSVHFTPSYSFRVCISDSPGAPFSSKREFQNAVNDLAPEYGYHFTFTSSFTKSTDFLITSGDRVTSKLTKAWEWETPVLTGESFIRAIKEGKLL